MVVAAVFPPGRVLIAILAVLAGVVILVWPRILAYVIGIYLILGGILALTELLL